jgi:hypothetical protein
MDRQRYDVLTRNPGIRRCVVRSAVLPKVFCVFISAIEENAVEDTNENVNDIWVLCDEFQLWSLLECVRAFKETPTQHIGRQNVRIETLEKQFEERSEHFQTQEASLETAVVRLLRVEAALERQSQAQESMAGRLTAALPLKGALERSPAHLKVGGNSAEWSGAGDYTILTEVQIDA